MLPPSSHEVWLTSLDGTVTLPLMGIGTVGDMQWSFRWGEGASGMYEAQWTMPLPAGFEHPLFRRGTMVEIKRGPWRLGSPLVLASPAKGAGPGEPWTFTATGIGREVEGENSFYAFRLSDDAATAVPSEAVDYAISEGWRVAGRAASVPTTEVGAAGTTEQLNTVGALCTAAGQQLSQRWGVGQDNRVFFAADPTEPSFQVVPGAAALGTADDDYASTVVVNFLDSASGGYRRRSATNADVEAAFGHREYPFDVSPLGAITGTMAQAFADGVLAGSKGRLAWTNSLTVTSSEILTMGGVEADLSRVAEAVGRGCMVRLNGIWSDLLRFNGQTYLDVVIAEAPYSNGASSIVLKPLGLAPRDLASVMERVTGMAA